MNSGGDGGGGDSDRHTGDQSTVPGARCHPPP